MSKENILYSLIGVGFGLFFGFVFVAWANNRATPPRNANARTEAAQDAGDAAPDDGQSSIAVADQARTQGMDQEVLKQARNSPQDFNAQMQAGRVSYDAKRYDDAIEFFLKANGLRPDETEPVVQLGNANFDAGHYEAAEKWYTAALVKEPDNVNVRTDLGLTFVLREPPDYERAIAEFKRSLERDPRHQQTLQNLVVAYNKQGDKADAQATLKRLQSVNPDNPAIPQLQADLQQ